MEVTRSSYYRWKRSEADRPQEEEDQTLLDAIQELRKDPRIRCYGSRRLVWALRQLGFAVGRKRVRRLMRQASIQVRRRRAFRPRTTHSNHDHPVALNLVARQFKVDAPNKVWAGDITYVRCSSGWVYLAVVIDLYSRRVIGWSIQPTLHRQLVIDALLMAIGNRGRPTGGIFHSDRGSQYASRQFRRLLKRSGMQASMSRKGDCWDNSPVESFFASLKKEALLGSTMNTAQIRQEVFEYIEVFYNRRRIHSALGGVSPEMFERKNLEPTTLCA